MCVCVFPHLENSSNSVAKISLTWRNSGGSWSKKWSSHQSWGAGETGSLGEVDELIAERNKEYFDDLQPPTHKHTHVVSLRSVVLAFRLGVRLKGVCQELHQEELLEAHVSTALRAKE